MARMVLYNITLPLKQFSIMLHFTLDLYLKIFSLSLMDIMIISLYNSVILLSSLNGSVQYYLLPLMDL